MGTQVIPVEFLQAAKEAALVVATNNATKIFNYNESVRHAADYTSKGLPVPAGYEPKIPILTRFNAEVYAQLLTDDEDRVKAAAGAGEPTEQIYDNLSEAYSFEAYVPPVAILPGVPPQPKNPLGLMIDDDNGIFAPALGDKLPVGSKFNFLGTEYLKKSFGHHNIAGVEQIYWVRQ